MYKPMVVGAFVRNLDAVTLAEYPKCRAAFCTRSRVSAETRPLPSKAFDAVVLETPASAATSFSVARGFMAMASV